MTAARGAYPPVDGSSADDVAVAEVVTAPKPRCGASTVRHPDDFCDEPATVPVSVACVHEHVRDSHACPVHAALLEEHICALCWRADGHRCRLMLLASA